ncbi:cell wall hydrolase [Phenylobacterium sp.]|uniref:cell wall hydrolase n=1 Tax=Phenylobacterium sp. TaxID=1871053 RepID=UPI002869F9C5|nr:cell wall hydrolase [Phenylobacterium sp.]
MQFKIKTPADWRASTCAALIGCGIGLALGAAYMAGGMARATTDHARASRLAQAAAGGFSESVLQREAAALDPGVLRIARRHDPFTMTGELDRQSAELTARLDAVPAKAEPIKLRPAFTRAAAPFHMAGALDSSRELECLTQAVYFEARGETPDGQAAVAQVVLNRVRHPAFPKSVCSVVYQGAAKRSGCQFSFACDGSMRRGREAGAWDRAQRVATKALSGFVMASVGDATHFHTTHVAPNWGPRMLRTAQVGLHVFYRFGRDAGRTYVAGRKTPAPELASDQTYARFTSAPGISAPVEIAGELRLSSAVKVDQTADAAAETTSVPAPVKAEAAKVTPTSAPSPAKPQTATPS